MQWGVSIIESRGRRRGSGTELNGFAVCLLVCLSFCLWRSDREPEGKVILRLWLCQQATNPPHKAQLTWSWLSAVFTAQKHMRTPESICTFCVIVHSLPHRQHLQTDAQFYSASIHACVSCHSGSLTDSSIWIIINQWQKSQMYNTCRYIAFVSVR